MKVTSNGIDSRENLSTEEKKNLGISENEFSAERLPREAAAKIPPRRKFPRIVFCAKKKKTSRYFSSLAATYCAAASLGVRQEAELRPREHIRQWSWPAGTTVGPPYRRPTPGVATLLISYLVLASCSIYTCMHALRVLLPLSSCGRYYYHVSFSPAPFPRHANFQLLSFCDASAIEQQQLG